jgi:hypothetical protein
LIIDYCISHRGTGFAEKRFYYLKKECNRSQVPRFRLASDGIFDRVQRSGLRTIRGMGGCSLEEFRIAISVNPKE